jgi:hypothetical protein
LLNAIEACDHAWVAALERVLESMGLSVARRLEARRHLLSPSHRLLTLIALGNWYGLPPRDDGDGLLADDMAAELLRLQRQNFQTTRDHIAALLPNSMRRWERPPRIWRGWPRRSAAVAARRIWTRPAYRTHRSSHRRRAFWWWSARASRSNA